MVRTEGRRMQNVLVAKREGGIAPERPIRTDGVVVAGGRGKVARHRMKLGRQAERGRDRDAEARKVEGGTCRQPA